ncbi:hypothetical protein BH10BDE1_BH10BDE1_12180 [soil metagenome]
MSPVWKFRGHWILSLIAGSAILASFDFAVAQNRPTLTAQPAPRGHYDEVFVNGKDEAGRPIKIVRPQYRDIIGAVADFDDVRIQAITRNSTKDFSGDNALTPIPRVFLDSEYDGIIKPGIDQRGRALREFIKDFHLSGGRPRIAEAGIIPQVILDRIVDRKQERALIGHVNPETIGFLYGPDILRDAKGNFRVVEDNFGFLGGLGDLEIALESMYRNVPEYPKLHEREPRDFFRELVRRYRQRAKPLRGKTVLLMTPPYSDNEEKRIRDLFAKEGVPTVTPQTKARVEFSDDGVWLRSKPGARRQRVGFVIVYGDYRNLDVTHEATGELAVLDYARRLLPSLWAPKNVWRRSESEAKKRFERIMKEVDATTKRPDHAALVQVLTELGHWGHIEAERRRSFVGLIEAVSTGRVAANYSPGSTIAEDKEFYPYVEKIIEFYLGEKPILKNIPTWDARVDLGRGVYGRLNEKLLRDVEKNQSKYVIKVVDGRGGEGIWVGAKVSVEQFAVGVEKLRTEPDRYKIQPYTALSVVGGMITDLRVHSDVPPRGQTFVSDTGWSRSLPIDGDGKVNISAEGRESTVIVRSSAKFCELLFESPSAVPASAIYRAR